MTQLCDPCFLLRHTLYSDWFDYSVVPILTTPHCMISVCLYIQHYSCLHPASYNYISSGNPYKLKISLLWSYCSYQPNRYSTCNIATSPRIPPLSLWKILTNGKIPYNQTVHATYTSPNIPPLSLWKILTNWKFSYNQPVHACNTPLHVSLPCLSGKSIQMEIFLTQ